MVLIKILKRRDAASIIVAILVAMIVSQPLSLTTSRLAGKISGVHNGFGGYAVPGGGWKSEYLFPIVWALVQLLVLEILVWIYVLANRPVARKK
jgi:uncharacterized membrane protein